MGDAKIKGTKQFCAQRNASYVQWTATWVNYRTKMRSLTHKRSSGTGLWQLDEYRHAKLQVQLNVIYTNNSTEVFPHHWSIWLHNKGNPKLSLCLFLSEGLTQREQSAFNPYFNNCKLENNIEILFKGDSLNTKAEKTFRKPQEYSYSCEGSKDRSYTYLKA